jgi:hypothetical protein
MKRSEYAVKLGELLYLEEWDDGFFEGGRFDSFDGDSLTRDRNRARRWPLSEIEKAAKAARFLGGRVVRFKTTTRRVVVGERDS